MAYVLQKWRRSESVKGEVAEDDGCEVEEVDSAGKDCPQLKSVSQAHFLL